MGTRSVVVRLVAILAFALGGVNGPLLGAPVPKEKPLDPSKVLELALKAADNLKGEEGRARNRERVLLWVASEFALCGDSERSLQLFKSLVRDDPGSESNFATVLRFMVLCGLAEPAVAMAHGRENWLDASSFRGTGRTDLLGKIVAANKLPDSRDQFRCVLVGELARLGKLADAEKVFEELGPGGPEHDRLDALHGLAVASHAAKLPERVTKHLDEMAGYADKLIRRDIRAVLGINASDIFVRRLVAAQVGCGRFDEARATVEKYEKDCKTQPALREIARALYSRGERKKALAEVDFLGQPEDRDYCLLEFLRGHVSKKEWKEAEELVEKMKVVPIQVLGYLTLARGRAEGGDSDAGRAAIRSAERVAGPEQKHVVYMTPGILSHDPKENAREAILRSKIRTDGSSDVLADALKIADPYVRARALMNIVRALRKPHSEEYHW